MENCSILPNVSRAVVLPDCAVGFFGQDCAEECLCQNGGLCHPVTGVCTCTAEWSGTHCNISEFGYLYIAMLQCVTDESRVIYGGIWFQVRVAME